MSHDRLDAMNAFIAQAGWDDAVRAPLPGDASTRRYVRLTRGDAHAMLMDQPQAAEAPVAPANATPEERAKLGYNALARLAGADCARFVAASDYLRARGLSAPEIYAADAKQGFVLLEDFGDTLYADIITGAPKSEIELYEAAIDALAELHKETAPAALGHDKTLFAYDQTALLAETDLLTEWFFPAAKGRPASDEEKAEHRALWKKLLTAPRRPVFVHRDYHAQNLLWLPGRSHAARTGLIDFQDAVAGSPAYDIVSLLEDARRDVPSDLAQAMMNRYIARAKRDGALTDEAEFRRDAALLAAQRNAKIIGIFARLAKRDGKTRYLSYLPRVWRYMEGDLAHPDLRGLKAWYGRTFPSSLRGALA